MEHKSVIGYYQIIKYRYSNCTNHILCEQKSGGPEQNQRDFRYPHHLRKSFPLFHLEGKNDKELLVSLIKHKLTLMKLRKSGKYT